MGSLHFLFVLCVGQVGAAVFTCAGSDVTLDWNFTTSSSDQVVDVEWYFQPEGGRENTIAGLIHGHFFTDLDRIEQVPLTGLKIREFKVSDEGVYSVRVNYRNDSGFFTFTASTRVQLIAAPVLLGAGLSVKRTAGAVLDRRTNQWSVQLECGHFQALGHPPVAVEWTTPSGRTISSSSSFHNGTFYLPLTNLTQSGHYSCAIADTSDAISCLTVHELRPLLTSSTVSVDAKDVEVDILLAEKAELERKVGEMTQQNQELTQMTQHLRNNMTIMTSELLELRRNASDLTSNLQSLGNNVASLTTQLQLCDAQMAFCVTTPLPSTRLPPLPIGHRCTSGDNCGHNATCAPEPHLSSVDSLTTGSPNYVCTCIDTHYQWLGRGVCLPKIEPGRHCTLNGETAQCVRYAACHPSSSTCVCVGTSPARDGRSCTVPLA